MTTYCACDRCGQTMHYDAAEHFYSDALCARCLERDRAPQGEAVRLFEPAPAQMPGQTSFSAAAAREGRPMNSDEQRADRWARIAASRAL